MKKLVIFSISAVLLVLLILFIVYCINYTKAVSAEDLFFMKDWGTPSELTNQSFCFTSADTTESGYVELNGTLSGDDPLVTDLMTVLRSLTVQKSLLNLKPIGPSGSVKYFAASFVIYLSSEPDYVMVTLTDTRVRLTTICGSKSASYYINIENRSEFDQIISAILEKLYPNDPNIQMIKGVLNNTM